MKHVDIKSRFPDHNILCMHIITSYNVDHEVECNKHDDYMADLEQHSKFTSLRHRFDDIPKEFMNNKRWDNKVVHFDRTIHSYDKTYTTDDSSIDVIYDELLDM